MSFIFYIMLFLDFCFSTLFAHLTKLMFRGRFELIHGNRFLTPLVYGGSPAIYISLDRADRDLAWRLWKTLHVSPIKSYWRKPPGKGSFPNEKGRWFPTTQYVEGSQLTEPIFLYLPNIIMDENGKNWLKKRLTIDQKRKNWKNWKIEKQNFKEQISSFILHEYIVSVLDNWMFPHSVTYNKSFI